MSGPIGWIILIIMAIATAAFLIIKNWDKIKAFFKKLWDAVVGIFKSAWEWIKGIWSGITGFFSNLWNGIKGTAGKIWGGIKNVISKAKDGVQKAWAGTKGFFGRLWGGIKEGASKGWNGIKNLFLNYTPHGLIIKHWDKIADWFTNIWSRVKEATVNAWNSIGEFFSGLGTRFFEWGKNLINSLWEGIKSMVNKVVEGVKNVAKKIAGGFKSFFGINSPSKLFTEYGVNITQGLTIGLDHGGANVEAATQGMAMQVTRGADSAMSANTIPASQLANNYSGGTSVQYSPNITIQGNMGPQEQQDFLRLLRQHGDEIVEIINRDRQNRDRLSFAY